MKRKTILLVLLGILVLVSGLLALAMSSTNYRLDWYVMLTGSGGGATGSTNCAANLTIGQTARGLSSSTNYSVGLGYWYGTDVAYRIYLPLTLKNHDL
jgi:hypothetical protein